MKDNLFITMLQKALRENYSVGAFNFYNMEGLKAICETAEELQSPVICAVSESALKYMSEEFTAALISAAKQKYSVPICFHLDHGHNLESCKKAIACGFDSVMIDLSSKSLSENITGTLEVVNYAHARNVAEEAELGTLSGVEDNVSVDQEDARYTSSDEAAEFVQKTHCDALAVAIGTSHGAFKFSGVPLLRFDILEKIEALLPTLPLVLHGASSISADTVQLIQETGGTITGAKGVTDELLKTASTHHICKINTDSDLRLEFIAGMRLGLRDNPAVIDPRKLLEQTISRQKTTIAYKIKEVFQSAGKAIKK